MPDLQPWEQHEWLEPCRDLVCGASCGAIHQAEEWADVHQTNCMRTYHSKCSSNSISCHRLETRIRNICISFVTEILATRVDI